MPSRADIEQLAAWLAATDIGSLELCEPNGTLRLERRGGVIDILSPIADPPSAAGRAATITAETPGIFLHGHPLRAAPLVDVGSDVRSGQMIGLLRVGVMLLPVRASRAGRIEGYWAEDGAAVGYGAPLIELHVSEDAR